MPIPSLKFLSLIKLSVSLEVHPLLMLLFPANTMEHVKELLVLPAIAQMALLGSIVQVLWYNN